jgi:hypothetical protein
MGTTNTMGIPYPESTDAVANGATAMESLAQKVDDKTGLVLVKTQVFSGSNTVQLTNCFNSLFSNYRLLFTCTSAPAAAAIINTSLLVGTTPNNTAGSYQYYEAGNTWVGTPDNTIGPSASSWFAIRSTSYFMGSIEIQNPFNPIYTTFQSSGVDSAQSWQARGQQILNNVYDGIQFNHAGGNLNGLTISCYGYRE